MSTDDRTARIFNSILEKLSGLSRPSDTDIKAASDERRIFKVRGSLQSQIEEPFAPQMVSIGPYHRGMPKLQLMEKYKLIYLSQLLDRTAAGTLQICVEAMANLEGVAQSWYTDMDISHHGGDDFVEMMLLDGCFIVESLWKLNLGDKTGDEILLDALLIDLLGIENQLPFFVLVELFDKTKSDASRELNHFARYLINMIPASNRNHEYGVDLDDDQVIHLLDLVYKACTSSFPAKLSKGIRGTDPHPEDDPYSVYHISSASELQGINGVNFQDNGNRPWLEITWENGVIKIPRFVVHVSTERLLRNLIRYEWHYTLHQKNRREYINDYAIFMKGLINSPWDVKVLRHSKIIINKLNDDWAVSDMFSRVTLDIYPGDDFCYQDVFSEVTKYARSRRHKWWTNLRRTYFNTPWSPISFVAAAVALILTFIQTLYAIRSGW